MRILIAEDHHVIRTALKTLISQDSAMAVVGEVADGAEIIKMVEAMQPDLLLMDARMPNHHVLRTARFLNTNFPQLRVLVLSAYKKREYVAGLLEAGASGYVLKDDPEVDLLQAIRTVGAGGRWVSPRALEVLVETAVSTPIPEPLTEREIETLTLMARGQRNAQIGAALDVTEQTIKNYARSIFAKINVETRVEAVLWALKNGYGEIGD